MQCYTPFILPFPNVLYVAAPTNDGLQPSIQQLQIAPSGVEQGRQAAFQAAGTHTTQHQGENTPENSGFQATETTFPENQQQQQHETNSERSSVFSNVSFSNHQHRSTSTGSPGDCISSADGGRQELLAPATRSSSVLEPVTSSSKNPDGIVSNARLKTEEDEDFEDQVPSPQDSQGSNFATIKEDGRAPPAANMVENCDNLATAASTAQSTTHYGAPTVVILPPQPRLEQEEGSKNSPIEKIPPLLPPTGAILQQEPERKTAAPNDEPVQLKTSPPVHVSDAWKGRRGVGPLRPLSAYNIFFFDERASLLGEPVTGEELEAYVRSRYTGTPRPKKKRRRRNPGDFGFSGMAKIIANRWSMVRNTVYSEKYLRLAKLSMVLYRDACHAFNMNEGSDSKTRIEYETGNQGDE